MAPLRVRAENIREGNSRPQTRLYEPAHSRQKAGFGMILP